MVTDNAESANNSAKKQLIAETAVEVFAEHGFAETRVKQIADAAGIGKGTVYLYFDNKAEILYEVFLNFEQQLHEILDEALDDPGTTAETIERLMSDLAEMVTNNRTMFSVLFDFWSQGVHGAKEHRIDFKSFYNRIRKKFEVILNEIVDRDILGSNTMDDLAYVLIGFFEGQMVQWLINPSSPSPEEVSELILTILIDGLTDELQFKDRKTLTEANRS